MRPATKWYQNYADGVQLRLHQPRRFACPCPERAGSARGSDLKDATGSHEYRSSERAYCRAGALAHGNDARKRSEVVPGLSPRKRTGTSPPLVKVLTHL